MQNNELLTSVQGALGELKPLGDIEQLLTKLVILPKDGSVYESEQAINNILKLKSFLEAMPGLFHSLSEATSDLLVRTRQNCHLEPATTLSEIIADTIDDRAAYSKKPLELRNQRLHTVKNGVSASLDIQRKVYEGYNKKVHDYVASLEDELRVRIALKYTDARKFYLRIRVKDFGGQALPSVLINRTRSRDFMECQTLKLVEHNERINQAVNGAMNDSDEAIKDLLAKVRPLISALFKYCESISLLDMIASFANISSSYSYARPTLQNDMYCLIGGRHPIMDSRDNTKCIPNDYFITEESRFQIITGQNMSGKSTYIRAIAMLHVMAQVGCFVPAESARMPILYNLFARVSTDDSLEANLSTFSVEMREMAFILRNVNQRSLVIVDELGRATSTRDGLAISLAISEALLQSGATVFFATHFTELAKGLANRIGVANRHLQTETQELDGDLRRGPVTKMLYRVGDGPETAQDYGIALAKAIGFPPSFIACAESVAARLRAQAEANRNNRQELEEAKRRKLVVNLERQLKLAQQSQAGDDELWQYFREIRDEFWSKMLSTGNDEQDESEAETSEDNRTVNDTVSDTENDAESEVGETTPQHVEESVGGEAEMEDICDEFLADDVEWADDDEWGQELSMLADADDDLEEEDL